MVTVTVLLAGLVLNPQCQLEDVSFAFRFEESLEMSVGLTFGVASTFMAS